MQETDKKEDDTKRRCQCDARRQTLFPSGAANGGASYGNHLFRQPVQAIEALPRIREIVALDKDLLFL
jgi:hypothetical protein